MSETLSQTFAISLIRGYRAIRGGLEAMLYSAFGFSFACKHSPTCSSYAISAIRRYGTMRGLLKGIWRILQCF